MTMTPLLENTPIDNTLATLGSNVTYTGATTTTLGWMLSSQFGIAVGVLIGVLGFALNFYYSRKRDQREQEAHAALMRFHHDETKLENKLQWVIEDGK